MPALLLALVVLTPGSPPLPPGPVCPPAAGRAGSLPAPAPPPFTMWVDERRHQVVIRVGPFPLPANPAPGEHGEGHEPMGHAHGLQLPTYRFKMPVSGWARGFRLEILDPSGRPLDRRLLHHVTLNHLDRRGLTFPSFERFLAAGQETESVRLPKSVGVPMEAGAVMAMASVWTNETETDLAGVVLLLSVEYLPRNLVPKPTTIHPILFDIGFRPGLTDGFDLDTGRTEFKREFVLPVDGRVLGLGGHLHDYGHSIELRDQETGKVLVTLKAELTPEGKLIRVNRRLFATWGEGLRLRAGRRYVVVARYHNTSGKLLRLGAMAIMAGVFAPDRPDRWPTLDRSDPVYLAECDGLGEIGWVDVPDSALGPPPSSLSLPFRVKR